MTALERTISVFKTGVSFARALSDERGVTVSPEMVTNWKRRGVPAECWLPCERISAGKVKAEEFEQEARARQAGTGTI